MFANVSAYQQLEFSQLTDLSQISKVRIDGNVEETAMNTELAHEQILKYFRSVTSNRWLMVKVFGVLIFFFILFVVFMA